MDVALGCWAYCWHPQDFLFLQLGFLPLRAKVLPKLPSKSMSVVPGILTCSPGSFSLTVHSFARDLALETSKI